MKKRWILLMMMLSLVIAGAWNSYPAIKDTGHLILDPSVGAILNWNIFWGFIVVIIFVNIVVSLVQKYTTNQEELREIKKEQKKLQEDLKIYKEHPEKFAEINKKSTENAMRMLRISMNSIVYTAIPFVLLFRWFADYFELLDYKFFGFLTWFWMYFILSIFLSTIIRKALKVE